jgi:Peroxidase, family 2
MAFLLVYVVVFSSLSWLPAAFPHLDARQSATASIGASAPGISAGASSSFSSFTWSPAQLIDVTGPHAYADPLPGQARGPCPAQNALANHGYLDRSGFTTFLDCVSVNKLIFNMHEDLAPILCFNAQLNGGDLLGLEFSIGNSTAVEPTIKSSCANVGILGGVLTFLKCSMSPFLDRLLGTPGFGMAQTHNSFEGDASFFKYDWGSVLGLDASSVDFSAFKKFWTKMLPDKTFDNFQIIADWASYRKQYSISTNPCAFRVPFATIGAALGAYALVPRLFSNFTPEYPNGTLTGPVLATWNGIAIDQQGNPSPMPFGRERIPDNW